ncbi:MAG: cardiolipin synthase [Deltaproteobacteria bacterium]|nr:cardiolipin synthase [Deltaproteobacteria bacterium]
MLVTLLTIAELVYVIGLAIWILFEKRSPVATLAWILALIALPYVGFLVFFFLGPRRVTRKRLKHKRARAQAEPTRANGDVDGSSTGTTEPPPQHDPRVDQLVALAKKAGEPPPGRCEEVTIFHDAATTYDAIEKAIREAKHHVHVAYYIFDHRRTGQRFRDALIAAAKAGVTVRVLLDDVGSASVGRRFVQPMRDAGIKVAWFNEVTFARIRSRIDFRNHRKIVVCDGRVGFTGGINVSDDYLPPAPEPQKPIDELRERRKERKGHAGPWRDTHARFTGDAVRWLQLTFLDDWYFTTGYAARDRDYFPPPTKTGDHLVHVLASGPDRETETIQKTYFAAITSAHERVLVTTPYFVPDDAILTALTTTAMRGVDVRVLVPRRSDSLVVTAAARSYYDACLAAGVRVYEYQPTMIHAKTLVVDDYFAAVGTANMDNRSFRLNFEVAAIFYGREHAETLATQFREDLKQSKEIKAATRAAVPVRWRIAEAGARVLSPLL